MKRITTIVLFASIFAVAVGTLGLSGNSATSLMTSAVPQSQEGIGMLGHVEYKLLDDVGNIKAYMQNDNIVVEAGKDCAAQDLFTPATGPTIGDCLRANGAFTYIGIGNGTITGATSHLGGDNATLADATDGVTIECSEGSPSTGGEMARRNVTANVVTNGGGPNFSTVVTLETSAVGQPFTFGANNNTSVIDSGIFNADYSDAPTTDHKCATTQTAGPGGTFNMFSRQLLNGVTGIAVSTGDSLSVKWTITVT